MTQEQDIATEGMHSEAAEPMAGEHNEIAVPIAALSEPDEQEQMTPPTVGDKGSSQIDYTVTRVEGETAYCTIDAINGTAIGKAQAKAPTDADQFAELEGMARSMPQRD